MDMCLAYPGILCRLPGRLFHTMQSTSNKYTLERSSEVSSLEYPDNDHGLPERIHRYVCLGVAHPPSLEVANVVWP